MESKVKVMKAATLHRVDQFCFTWIVPADSDNALVKVTNKRIHSLPAILSQGRSIGRPEEPDF